MNRPASSTLNGDEWRTYDDLRITPGDDFVVEVEIARPPNNFFDTSLIIQLADAFSEIDQKGYRAIVLCSEGRHFCAGADFSGNTTVDPAAPHLYDVAIRLFEQPLPVVAAVQGAAIGGGLGLAMVADFRVASPEARFCANFSQLGFHHGFALSASLPFAVGNRTALDLLYTGRRVPGSEAFDLGLCDELVALEDLPSAARARAAAIAGSAPLAVRSIRETMRARLVSDARTAMARERSEQDRLMQTADWREGVRANAERRPPTFTAR